MAHKTHLAILAANASADAVTALLDGGYLRIYTPQQPATPETAVSTQTLLAELRFANPAFGAASGGVATANAITPETSAKATGTAHWFRAFSMDGTTVVLDGNVGTGGSVGLRLSSTSVVIGAEVSVDSFTYTQPVSE